MFSGIRKLLVIGSVAGVSLVGAGSAFASSTDPGHVVVHSGDTLSGISQSHLGNSAFYKEIAALNDLSNPNLIFPGQVLVLPGTGAPISHHDSTPPSTPPHHSTPPAPHNPSSNSQANSVPQGHSGVNWNAVAQCESTSNWHANTGNGFSGGLQFTQSTWAAYGGLAYAPTAAQATPAQQIAVAERVLAGQGIGAWPVCGHRG